MKLIIKALSILLVVNIMYSTLLTTSYAAPVIATPTASTIEVNDKPFTFEAYNIAGNNYFKLRDIAMALTATTAKFSVDWDEDSQSIYLLTAKFYMPEGGELSLSGNTEAVKAVPSASKIYLNGKQINLTGYTIGGSNYYKLRDIGRAIDFGVSYEEQANTINIETSVEYYIQAIMDELQENYYTTAPNILQYDGTDTGSITIIEFNDTSFSIIASKISTDKDYALLRDIIGVFISAPDQVMDTIKTLEQDGEKEIQLEDKTVICAQNGQTLSIDISWS